MKNITLPSGESSYFVPFDGVISSVICQCQTDNHGVGIRTFGCAIDEGEGGIRNLALAFFVEDGDLVADSLRNVVTFGADGLWASVDTFMDGILLTPPDSGDPLPMNIQVNGDYNGSFVPTACTIVTIPAGSGVVTFYSPWPVEIMNQIDMITVIPTGLDGNSHLIKGLVDIVGGTQMCVDQTVVDGDEATTITPMHAIACGAFMAAFAIPESGFTWAINYANNGSEIDVILMMKRFLPGPM